MKKISAILLVGTLAGVGAMLIGCEWEATDNGYNTSKGAGVNVNFSGVYTAKSGSSSVVSSVASITQFTIAQTGNALEIWDTNDSYYTGSIGSPGVVSSPDSVTGLYSAGAILVQSQVSFSGKDEATGVSAGFVGIIHAVAVTDVTGSTVTTSTSSSTPSSSTQTNTTVTWVWMPSGNSQETGPEWVTATITAHWHQYPDPDPLSATYKDPAYGTAGYGTAVPLSTPSFTYSFDTLVAVTNSEVTSTGTATSNTTSTVQYSITQANTQYVLQGNWSERGSDGTVYGLAAAQDGTFTP